MTGIGIASPKGEGGLFSMGRVIARHQPSVSAAFRDWLSHAQAKCALPLVAEDQDDGGLDIIIRTKRSALTATLSDHELAVPVIHHGECWDFLLSLDVAPMEDPAGGFICGQCDVETRETFQTVDLLWHDHLFEPMRTWINTEVYSATGIALFRTDGATWARLLKGDETAKRNGAEFILSL